MRAVIKAAAETGAIQVADLPVPEPGPGQVLLRVVRASICGSDLNAYRFGPAYAFMRPPVIMGHEFAGAVAAVGPDVMAWSVGDRVVPESIVACGECPRCRSGRRNICDRFQILGMHCNGGFAEYAAVPAALLHRLPDQLSFDSATWVEPVAVAVHAVLGRSPVQPGDRVAVVGPGPIGILVAQVARAAGARVVLIGTAADAAVRLPLARNLGLETRVAGEGERVEADAAFECSGHPAGIAEALAWLVKGGTLVGLGLFKEPVSLDLSPLVRREVSVQFSFAAGWQDYRRAIDLLTSGDVQVDPLAAPFGLASAEAAFQAGLRQKVLKPVFQVG